MSLNHEENKNEGNFETRAIHFGQEYDQWGHNEIVPPIVTSVNYYQYDPTNSSVSLGFFKEKKGQKIPLF